MDLPDWLVLPVFSGAIALILNRSNKRLDTSEKFIVQSSLLGFLPSLLVLAIRDSSSFIIHYSDDVILLLNLLWATAIAFIAQWLLTSKFKIIKEDDDQISNLLESEIIRAIKLNNDKTNDPNNSVDTATDHIIELKSGKIYVGQIEYIDIKDSSPINEKFLGFRPAKSGQRNQDGSVTYTSYYYPAFGANQTADEYEKIIFDTAAKIKSIFIPLSEVLTIREFDLDLDTYFGHSYVNPDSKSQSP